MAKGAGAVSRTAYTKRVAVRATFSWEVTRQAALLFVAVAVLSAAAVLWVNANGYTLYYGDAEAHLNIARRIVDSRTPGIDQIGTVWLPLPHLLIIPFVRNDALWQSGLAGAIPTAMCFVFAAMALYGIARRAFIAGSAAITAALLFALNPNMLYLQSIPMTEVVFCAGFLGMVYCTLVFRDTQSILAVIGAGLFSAATTMTRYEGWFVIPFVAVYLAWVAERRRVLVFLIFGSLSGLAPLWWLAHNWYYFGDALYFYDGPSSPKAIQHGATYPGDHDWAKAFLYFRTAVQLCAGWPLVWIGLAGVVAAFAKRMFWPVAVLLLPGIFYVWSMHSSGGTPIFVPSLWPHSYYNTRYGTVVIPLLAFAGAAIVALMPAGLRPLTAAAVIIAAVVPWVFYPRPEAWICWKESEVNSVARRAWTGDAAQFLRAHYHRGEGVFTSFGDLTGVYREAGIPLRETVHEGNTPEWMATVARPDLFLTEQWAVGIAKTPVTNTVSKPGLPYALVDTVTVNGAPPVEIYRRKITAPSE